MDLAMSAKNRAPINGFIKVLIGEFDRIGKNLSDEQCLSIIKKMHGNAVDLDNLDEAKYLSKYIPKQLSETEIETIIEEIVSNPVNRNIGAIMKHFNMNYKGKVDNKLVSEKAKKVLT